MEIGEEHYFLKIVEAAVSVVCCAATDCSRFFFFSFFLLFSKHKLDCYQLIIAITEIFVQLIVLSSMVFITFNKHPIIK